jgi:uncharacterized protein
MGTQTWQIGLDQDECEDLLRQATLGRLGVIVDGRPEIFPVNHVFDEERGCVAFPTNARTKLHAALNWPWVAFEVDGCEDEVGWSVLVVGQAEEITDAGIISRLARQRHVLWAGGEKAHWLRIVPSKITGRRVCGVGVTTPAPPVRPQ